MTADASAVVTGRVVGFAADGTGSGLAGVAVSDGAVVTRTDADGGYRLLVDPSRRHTGLVQLTIPSGWRAPVGRTRVPEFFRRVPLESRAEVTADFVVHADESQSDLADGCRFVVASDVHVQDGAANTRAGFTGQLERINAFAAQVTRGAGAPVGFLVVSGDVTNDASPAEFADYLAALTASDLPVWTAPGNHDLVGRVSGGATAESTFPGPYRDVIDGYRQAVGPEWYSFQYGGYHVVVLENYLGLTESDQFTWLEQDLAAHADRRPVIVVAHVPWNVPQTPVESETARYLDLLSRYDVHLFLTGHTHTNEVTAGFLGTASQVVTTSLAVPEDRAPRAFRLVELGPQGPTAPVVEVDAARRVTVVGRSAVDTDSVWIDHDHPPAVATEVQVRSGGGPWTRLRPVGRRTWTGALDPDGRLGGAAAQVRIRDRPEDGWTEHDVTIPPVTDAATTPRPGAPWPTFHGDARRSGATPDEPATPLRPAWITHAGGSIATSSPVISGRAVVIGVRDEDATAGNGVLALDLTTGERRWRFPTDSAVDASATLSDAHDLALVPETHGRLHALDLDEGRTRWTWRPAPTAAPAWMYFSPTIVGDVAYLAYSLKEGTHVVALDVATGAVRWHTGSPMGRNWYSHAGPTVHGDLLVVATAYATLVALDARTGTTRWETPLAAGVGVRAKPVIADDMVLLACQGDRLETVDAATGKPRWSHRASGPALLPGTGTTATPAVADGRVYAAFINGGVVALDLATGAPTWRFPAGAPVLSSPALGGHTLYVGANDGVLRALDRETGQCRWHHDLGSPIISSPAVTGTTVVAAAWSGLIGAFTGGG